MRLVAPFPPRGYISDVVVLEILDVTESNVDNVGFFCAMSNPELKVSGKACVVKSALPAEDQADREGGRGFIEYLPGEFVWRAIEARRYMVIP